MEAKCPPQYTLSPFVHHACTAHDLPPPPPPMSNERLVQRTLLFGPYFFMVPEFIRHQVPLTSKLGTERHVQRTLLFKPYFSRILLFAGHGGGGGGGARVQTLAHLAW